MAKIEPSNRLQKVPPKEAAGKNTATATGQYRMFTQTRNKGRKQASTCSFGCGEEKVWAAVSVWLGRERGKGKCGAKIFAVDLYAVSDSFSFFVLSKGERGFAATPSVSLSIYIYLSSYLSLRLHPFVFLPLHPLSLSLSFFVSPPPDLIIKSTAKIRGGRRSPVVLCYRLIL